MTKMFFDVFPTLEVNGDMKKLLSETEVTKVGMNHEKDHIRIYLNGTRLIHKKNIYQLEKNIHDQIFKNRHMDVKVIEKYQLSEQYTAEKLMDLYKDSILEELKNYSLMEYNLLRSAKMEFTGDSHLLLTLENTIIAQTRSHEIVEFLEKVVCERCGLDLSVELAFEEPKESKHKKNSDLQIQFEIKNILKHRKPDAIFASDDLTAILIMKVAQELEIKIPEDLKVIGYDGTYFVESYYPQLATIQQPLKDIACLLVDLLLRKIAGEEVVTTGYFLPVHLSSGKSI